MVTPADKKEYVIEALESDGIPPLSTILNSNSTVFPVVPYITLRERINVSVFISTLKFDSVSNEVTIRLSSSVSIYLCLSSSVENA